MVTKQRAPQSIGINFSAKCNARCAHCCVDSSPDAAEHLTDAQVDQILTKRSSFPRSGKSASPAANCCFFDPGFSGLSRGSHRRDAQLRW